MTPDADITAFDALLRTSPDVRRVYLLMLDARKQAIVATAFRSARSMEELEHARGRVAMLDELITSHTKEDTYAARRSDYAHRAGESLGV